MMTAASIQNSGTAASSAVTLTAENMGQPLEKNEKVHKKQIRIQPNDTEKQKSVDEPPDGGLLAWLQVVACFIFFLNSWDL